MKKTIVFILALALLMLVAIPATAGPVYALPTIETAMPSILTTAVKTSMPVENTLYFQASSPPFFARILASPLVFATSATKTTIYTHAVMAMLAALLGLGLAILASHPKYDIRDRMHRLPRDQDCLA